MLDSRLSIHPSSHVVVFCLLVRSCVVGQCIHLSQIDFACAGVYAQTANSQHECQGLD